MRYFICALDNIGLGIPAERTERIIPVTRIQAAVSETEDHETFISLPALFQRKNIDVPHGVVLKSGTADTVKTVLLTPRIDIEIEIPEENIHQLPKAFAGLIRFFRGACFIETDAGNSLILILSPEKLMENIR
jgi:hypothetical protein